MFRNVAGCSKMQNGLTWYQLSQAVLKYSSLNEHWAAMKFITLSTQLVQNQHRYLQQHIVVTNTQLTAPLEIPRSAMEFPSQHWHIPRQALRRRAFVQSDPEW